MKTLHLSLKDAFILGQYACDYARSIIQKTSTHPNDNQKGNYYTSHRNAVAEMRASASVYAKNSTLPYEAAYFINAVRLVKKYSIGNCREYALLALDYVLHLGGASINAEVYRIQNGDHMFLVINRNRDSDAHDPTTWGEAIICDPWQNEVYPASDYLQKLKIFTANKGMLGELRLMFFAVQSFGFKPFDKNKHALKPDLHFNTKQLLSCYAYPGLQEKYNTKFNSRMDYLYKIMSALKAYCQINLPKENQNVSVSQNKIIKLLHDKINKLGFAIHDFKVAYEDNIIIDDMNKSFYDICDTIKIGLPLLERQAIDIGLKSLSAHFVLYDIRGFFDGSTNTKEDNLFKVNESKTMRL